MVTFWTTFFCGYFLIFSPEVVGILRFKKGFDVDHLDFEIEFYVDIFFIFRA